MELSLSTCGVVFFFQSSWTAYKVINTQYKITFSWRRSPDRYPSTTGSSFGLICFSHSFPSCLPSVLLSLFLFFLFFVYLLHSSNSLSAATSSSPVTSPNLFLMLDAMVETKLVLLVCREQNKYTSISLAGVVVKFTAIRWWTQKVLLGLRTSL